MFRRRRLLFAAAALPVVLALVVAVQVATARDGATAIGPGLGADYPAFYAAGRLLLEHPGDRLYDLPLQTRLGNEARPGAPPEGGLLFVLPPPAALPFVPLALLPYTASYLAWMAVSVGVAAAGLAALRRGCPNLSRADWLTAAGLGFAAQPLLAESIVGGQIAVMAFAAACLALVCVRRGQWFLAGLALSLLAYKPTLLVLFGPLVLLGGRWRTVAGLAVGGLAFLAVSLLIAGPSGCLDWVRLMTGYGRLSAESAGSFRLFKFVDLNSALRLTLGDRPWVAVTAAVLAVPALIWLAAAWLRRSRYDEAALWAATSTWTLVLNLHVAAYDLSLAVPGVLVTLDTLARRNAGRLVLAPPNRAVLAVAWCVPWVAQPVAMTTAFNPLTPVLVVLAAWQLRVARVPPPEGRPAPGGDAGANGQ
jgi:hypothetical protein